MKKRFSTTLIVLLTVLLAAAFVACDKTETNDNGGTDNPGETTEIKLDAPTVTLTEDGVARWNSVKYATDYLLEINGKESGVTQDVEIALDYGYTLRVKAMASGEYEGKSEWSNSVTREKKSAETLFAPQPYIDGEYARWNTVDGAIGYEIDVDGKVFSLGQYENEYRLEVNQTARVRAIGDGENYLDSVWSETITRTNDGGDSDDGDNPDEPQNGYVKVTKITEINDLFVTGLDGYGTLSVIKKNKDETAITVDGEPLELYQEQNNQNTYYRKEDDKYVVFCERWAETINYNGREYRLAQKATDLTVEAWYSESDVDSGKPFSVKNVGTCENSVFTFLDKTFTLYRQAAEKGEDGKKGIKLLAEDKDGNYSIAEYNVAYNGDLYVTLAIGEDVYCNAVNEVSFDEGYRGDYVTESGKIEVVRVKEKYVALNADTLGSFTKKIKDCIYVVLDDNYVRTVFDGQNLTLGDKTYKKPTVIDITEDSAFVGTYIFDEKNFIKVSENNNVSVNGTQKAQIMTLTKDADLLAVFVRGEYEAYDRYDYERITLENDFGRGEKTYARAEKIATTDYKGVYKKSASELITVSEEGVSYGGETYEIFKADDKFYGINDKIVALSLGENKVTVNDAAYEKITLIEVAATDLSQILTEKYTSYPFYCVMGTSDDDEVLRIALSCSDEKVLINNSTDNALYKDENGNIVAALVDGNIYPFGVQTDATTNKTVLNMNGNAYYAMTSASDEEKENFLDKRFYQITNVDDGYSWGKTLLFASTESGVVKGFYSDSAKMYLGGKSDKTALDRDCFILSPNDNSEQHALMKVGDYYCLTASMNDWHCDLFFKVDENGNIDGVGKNNDYGIVKPLETEESIDEAYLKKAYNEPYGRIEWVERGTEYFELKANVSTAFRGTPNPYNSTISYVYYVEKDGKTIYLRNNYAPIVTAGDYTYFVTSKNEKQYFLFPLETANAYCKTNDSVFNGSNSGTIYYRASLTALTAKALEQVAQIGHYYKAYRETRLESDNGGPNYVYMDLAIKSFEKSGISLIYDSSIAGNRNTSKYTRYELVDAYYYDYDGSGQSQSAERRVIMTFKGNNGVYEDNYRTFKFTFTKGANIHAEIDKTRMSYNPLVRVSKKNLAGGEYEWWSSDWQYRNPSEDIKEFRYRSGDLQPVDDFDSRLGVYGYRYENAQKLGNSDFSANLSDLYSIIKTANDEYKFVFNGVSNVYAGYTAYTNKEHSYELASYDIYTDGDKYYWGKVNACYNNENEYVVYGELSFDDDGLTLVDYYGEDPDEADEHGVNRYPVDKTTQLTALKEITFDEEKISLGALYTYGTTSTTYKAETNLIFTSTGEALKFDYSSYHGAAYPGQYDSKDEKLAHKVKFYVHGDVTAKMLVYVVSCEENFVVANGVLATIDTASNEITGWKWSNNEYTYTYSKTTDIPVKENVKYISSAYDVIEFDKDGKVSIGDKTAAAEYYVRSYEETVGEGEAAVKTTYYDYIVLAGGEQIRIEKATKDGNNVVVPQFTYYTKEGRESVYFIMTEIEFSDLTVSGTYKEESWRERTIEFDTAANKVTVQENDAAKKEFTVTAVYKFNPTSKTSTEDEVTIVDYVNLFIVLGNGGGFISVTEATIAEENKIALPSSIVYENVPLCLIVTE